MSKVVDIKIEKTPESVAIRMKNTISQRQMVTLKRSMAQFSRS